MATYSPLLHLLEMYSSPADHRETKRHGIKTLLNVFLIWYGWAWWRCMSCKQRCQLSETTSRRFLFVDEHCTQFASRTLSSVTQALLETASWANTFVTSSAKGWRPSSIVLQNTFFLNIDQTIRFDIISSRWQHVCAICVRHSWKQWQDIWKSLHRLLERSAAEAVACKPG